MAPRKRAAPPAAAPASARATRARVRAGSAALEEDSQIPSKRASRKGSASGTGSRAQSVVSTEASPPPTSTSSAENSKIISASVIRPDSPVSKTVILSGVFYIKEIKAGRLSPHALTKPELEVLAEALLARDEQQERHIDAQNKEFEELAQAHGKSLLDVMQLQRRVTYEQKQTEVAERYRDLRRHISIERPAQELMQQESRANKAAAEAARARQAELEKELAETRAEQERQAKLVVSPVHDDVQTNGTPKQLTLQSLIETSTPEPISDSPSSWGISFIFSSVKKVFSPSPTKRRTPQVRSRVHSRVPSPIREESPSQTRDSPSQQQQHTEDKDMTQIVRKRKATETAEDQTPKKTKITDSANSSFNVPSDSESDGEAMVVDTVAQQETVHRHSTLRTPDTARKVSSSDWNDIPEDMFRSASASRSSKIAKTSTPKQNGFTPSSKISTSARAPRTPTAERPGATDSSESDDTSSSQLPKSVRRTARSVRQDRATKKLAELQAVNKDLAPAFFSSSDQVFRPYVWELVNSEQYDTQEALDDAIDAMLAVEEAEDKGLPRPQTNVPPASRIVDRVRPEHLAPIGSVPSNRSTPRPATSTKPRESNADKRDTQLKAAEERLAERRRLQERADRLREEQRRAEEALNELLEDEQAGKKRKRVNVDELKTIPSRRKGESTGTFALLDEFFEYDDEGDDFVEMDESEIDLYTPRPTKMARTEINLFDHESPPPETPTPATSQQPSALQKQRTAAEKYKPAVGSRLREVQRPSLGSSAPGSPSSPGPSASQYNENDAGSYSSSQPMANTSWPSEDDVQSQSVVEHTGNSALTQPQQISDTVLGASLNEASVASSTKSSTHTNANIERKNDDVIATFCQLYKPLTPRDPSEYDPAVTFRPLTVAQRRELSVAALYTHLENTASAYSAPSSPTGGATKGPSFKFPSASTLSTDDGGDHDDDDDDDDGTTSASQEHEANCLVAFRAGLAARFPNNMQMVT